MKAPAHHGTTAKHSSSKHAAAPAHGKHKPSTAKHTAKTHRKKAPSAVGKSAGPAKPAKPRKLTPGSVACCPAEAVAAAARMAGWMVTDQDVLDLYARCADGPSSGFTIAAALTAVSRRGIGVARLVNYARQDQYYEDGQPQDEHSGQSVDVLHALILGVDLPGPHAVTIAPDGCWVSWGRHYDPSDFPGAVVEEAWAVSFG